MLPDRSPGRPGAAAVPAVLPLAPFTLLGALVVSGWRPLREADAAVTDTLHSFAAGRPGWVDAMTVGTNVFSPTVLRVAVLVLVIWLVRRRQAVEVAWWAGLTMAAGGILNAVLKLLVSRDRPDLPDPVAQAVGYSFASGHALNAAVAAGVFVLVLRPLVHDRPGRRAALWAAAVVVPLIAGLTRIGLGVHWTSDVVAGWLLGVAVVALSTLAFRRRRARAARRPARATAEPANSRRR